MSHRYARTHKPREYVASFILDHLYYTLARNEFCPDDSPEYRRAVARQMLQQIDAIGRKHNLDFVHPQVKVLETQSA